MLKKKEKISALIITYNEIDNISRCINSVSFADEIIVVDSYSTDGTYEYLQNHSKIKVIQHSFENYTTQKSFTLKQASNDWVLFIDADEVVTPTLKNEILTTINNKTEHTAFWFKRTFMFSDKKVNFSGCQTDKNYRLFRKSNVSFNKNKIVHETLNVNGSSGILKNKLIHYSYENYQDFKSKNLKYGRLKAIESFNNGKRFSYFLFMVKPIWKFFNNYFLRLGILDGKKGLILSYIHALSVTEHYKTLYNIEKRDKNSPIITETFLKNA